MATGSDHLFKLSDKKQADIINMYRQQGVNLKCYDNLRPEEKLSKFNDYLCWAPINEVFDHISAKQLAFFFYHEKLVFVRLELPPSSYGLLEKHLNTEFGNKVEELSQRFDSSGERVLTWKTPRGFVSASKGLTPQQTFVVLWMSSEELRVNAMDKLLDFFRKLVNTLFKISNRE